MSKKFAGYAAVPGCENWDRLISRQSDIYGREDDIRTPFGRDYTRVLHSLAFRRLKHKTQVFFNAGENDHICTRIEHVLHVESVSSTISEYLGLNTELTKVISMAHDLGHAPFGHQGEHILDAITKEYLGEGFWHERNGLYFVDNIELLEDYQRNLQGLNLTYAVRDGIISHCGETDENGLRPRNELIDLADFKNPGQYQACTWEGCVVKFSDKIAYLGRDIEDALRLGIIDEDSLKELKEIAGTKNAVNTTVIMHNAIIDLCKNSSPESGLTLSGEAFRQINSIKKFNYEKIYLNPLLLEMNKKAKQQLEVLFLGLNNLYNEVETIKSIDLIGDNSLVNDFASWLSHYVSEEVVKGTCFENDAKRCRNKKIYGDLSSREQYIRAVIDYIAGMTDAYADKAYEEVVKIC